ncbi:MAG: cupredoxin domain-containing protein [Nitriliruptorales bacterium]
MNHRRPLTRRRRTLVALLALGGLALVASTALAATASVDVQDDQFVPATVTIEAGDTVEWTQSGNNPHTITADDGSFDSHPDCNSFADGAAGNCMSNGDSNSQTFETAGEIAYYCKIHGAPGGQGMSGTIVVTAGEDDGGAGEDDGGEEGAAVTGSISAADQSGDGSTVTVDSVTISGAPGWVVVHADNEGSPGAVLGHVSIPEGTSTDVEVTLDAPLDESQSLWPMLHEDAGEEGTYEFPGADVPVMDDSGVVMMQISFTVGGELAATGPVGNLVVLGFVALVLLGSGYVLIRRRTAEN